ncbi:hypothetical protein [Haladaptatus sp. AB643]|uniref:DUF7537 family lipoprotein n=1 Tax=Haladaptatus sp. AB643 TaxID=2934174 RepID=UPI00209C3256|nr:hypothetical protein [Haladaptatus sp. AB643]MCO8242857.1 hypothetical protein [Haladaptatus sp. AB643]
MRRLAPVLLALLVLMAGCANFLPWSDSQSDPQQTTANHPASYPPGANGQWIFDAEQLVATHKAALSGANYRMHARVRPNQQTASVKWQNTTTTVHIGSGRTLVQGSGGSFGPRELTESYRSYSTDNMTVQCRRGAEKCRYLSTRSTQGQQITKRTTSRMESLIASSDFVANGTTARNGTTLYRYEANGSTTFSGADRLSATVLVDEDGLIHDVSGTIHTDGKRPATVDFNYGFSLVSNPPTKPEWVDGVPRLTVRTSASRFTLEHEGGERIPAGTNVSLTLINDSATAIGTVRLPKSLGRGDIAYLTISDIEDTDHLHYKAVGNITVNHPATTEPGINHTHWTLSLGYETKHWKADLWVNPEGRNHDSTNGTKATTTTTAT